MTERSTPDNEAVAARRKAVVRASKARVAWRDRGRLDAEIALVERKMLSTFQRLDRAKSTGKAGYAARLEAELAGFERTWINATARRNRLWGTKAEQRAALGEG